MPNRADMVESGKADASVEVEYVGYQPVCAADYPFREDEPAEKDFEKGVDPALLTDKRKRSKSLVLCMIVFALCFLALFVWQVLVAKCVVRTLCETIDASSELSSVYIYKTVPFRVPSALVWIGLTAGSLALTIASKWMYDLLRIDVGPAKLLEMSMIMRKGSSVLLTQQYVTLLGPLLVVFILLGVGINWKTGCCFIIGALMSAAASHTGVSIATRGQVRTAAQAYDDVKSPFKRAYRSGSVISAAILGIAVAGTSALYLMFSDVRALAGLAAGSSASAMFMRMSTGIFSRATNKTASSLFESPEDEGVARGPRDAPVIAAYVGSGMGSIIGVGSDMFSSLVSAVIATAILGSSLPFFYRDSFAMCVFNHLYIDQLCGPFGYPQELSYATYICRNENLYLEYPALKTWASNSAFVAVPFVLAVIGLLVSIICTTYPLYGKIADSYEGQAVCVIRGVRMTMRRNYMVGYLLFIIGSAALCFGLFGPKSEFQKYNGLGIDRDLLRMDLDGSDAQCVSKFLNESSSSAVNPEPVPQGGALILDHYRPITASGSSIGKASSTPWRLFGCILIGVALASIMTGISSDHFTSVPAAPTAKVLRALEDSSATAVVQVLGSGLMSTVAPSVLIITALISSYSLFGSYGTGITTLGFLCSGGSRITVAMMSHVADNSNNITSASKMGHWRRTFSEVLSLVGSSTSASSIEFANGSSVLTACTLLLALVHQSGILPSPRDLVGSPERAPSRFIGNPAVVPLSDIFVSMSVIVGTMIPFLVAGLLILGASRAADAMVLEAQQYRRTRIEYAAFFSKITSLALLESIIPVAISALIPLVIGFGFGQRALVGLLVSLVPSGYILGTFLSSTASSWNSAERHLAADLTPSEQPPQNGDRYMPRLLREGRGRFTNELVSAFRECAGPSLLSLIKLTTSVGLMTVTLMRPGSYKGWIGGIVLGVLVALAVVLTLLKRCLHAWKSPRMAREAEERAASEAPPKRVSPFYVEGTMIDPATVQPGSHVHEALLVMGNPTLPMPPRSLPGISDSPGE